MSIIIYHNPDCGTSRNTLAMIRQSGAEPEIVEYLKTPPTRQYLAWMIAQAGLTVRQAVRQKDTPYMRSASPSPPWAMPSSSMP